MAPVARNNETELGKNVGSTVTAEDQRMRWFLVGWITVSTIINIIDKNTLAILGPTLKEEFGLSNQFFASVLNAFMFSYAIMYTVGGRLVDKFGEKICMTGFVLWWSISCMLHATVKGALSLGIFRFLLGLGEPGNYPAALRFTTKWFAKSERGLPISIWSVGSSIGHLVAAPLIAFIAIYFGWRMAFLLPGSLGLLWVLVWVLVYRRPAPLFEGQAGVVDFKKPEQKNQKSESLLNLIKNKKVMGLVLARLVSDPVWHFYNSWIAIYLSDAWGYKLKEIGLFVWIPFLFGAAGGIFGGMFSDRLIRRGIPPVQARKRVLFTAGILAPLGITVSFAQSSAIALGLIAVIAFIVYIWFITTAALVTDIFPARTVATVLGLMGTAGTLGGMGLNWAAGYILDTYHSFTPVFMIAGLGHLLAALILFIFFREGSGDHDSGQLQFQQTT